MSESESEVRAANRASLEAIREFLRVGDWSSLAASWAEDGVMELPFAPAGSPTRIEGAEAIRRNQSASLDLFTRFETPEFVIFPTTDPDVFFAEYTSDALVRTNGKPYRNTYVGYFRFRLGKLLHWKEYFNPSVIREAFRS